MGEFGADPALVASQSSQSSLSRPSGFDPGDETGCPYDIMDPRWDAWLQGYQAALSWISEAVR
jgi:hypothetical protein